MKALVTGASGALGAVVATRLAADGFEVLLHFHTGEEGARACLAQLEANGGNGRLVQFDVRSTASVEAALVPLLQNEGPMDVLVNNAGAACDGYLAMLPEAAWNDVIEVNLGGFFRVTRACLKGMMQRRAGRVINIGSLAGRRPDVGQVAYAAAKAGLEGATRALAMEVARWNILVNAVAPGPLEVGMASTLDTDKIKGIIPLGRLGRAEEVAGVVSFLAGKDASYITGQTIPVNGGMGM